MTALPAPTSSLPVKPRTVREVMVIAPYLVQSNHPLVVAQKLMQEKHIRHLPVFNGRELVGVLAERALHAALERGNPATATVGAAELTPALVVGPEEPLAQAVRKMAKSRSDVAIVMDRDRAVGVFTTIDALGVLASLLEG